MKKLTILGATTLAGTLLFTGLGTAHADQVINDANVKKYAEQTIGSKYNNAGKITAGNIEDKGDYYTLGFGTEKDNGIASAKVYKDGRVVGNNPQEPTKSIVYAKAQNQPTQNNNQSEKATNNTVNTQQNEQQTQATNSNATTQNNIQDQAKALPETGQSNTTFVTTLAAILLAVGSLLTFRRVSKNQ
ncbi:LPXTG cell wall anchor domain-containing protein [Staphylococcus pasteuri]|uniref:LPXTG cell wall anchor domain-containing protein n=1 Tax=Staphylococcus pasteuri TaxID=45972 RepID=UPI001E3EC2BF|nr:LPXTG cell wall anchor domain-containing protein [Staphylococcus pasteuri]MCE3022795.1 LPXTG cell wall anchor domain-containing protein [Staphylococcus pasteuri]